MTTIPSPRRITGASEPCGEAAARKSSGGLRPLSAPWSWAGGKRISARARGAGRAGARCPRAPRGGCPGSAVSRCWAGRAAARGLRTPPQSPAPACSQRAGQPTACPAPCSHPCASAQLSVTLSRPIRGKSCCGWQPEPRKPGRGLPWASACARGAGASTSLARLVRQACGSAAPCHHPPPHSALPNPRAAQTPRLPGAVAVGALCGRPPSCAPRPASPVPFSLSRAGRGRAAPARGGG